MSGILNWALQGSRDWYRDGLMPPSEVLLATEKYRTEMDGFSRFLDEGIITERLEAQTSKAELYSVYSQWCTDEGVEMLTKMELGTRMKQRGYEEGRSNSGRYWKNMAIEDAEEYSL